jgi:F-type H+-transporting ATPase subunit a
MSFANPQVDSVQVHWSCTRTTEKSQEGAHAEPTDVKSEIKAFIGHHVLDSHDFTFLSDEVEEHYGFRYRFCGITGYIYFIF